MDSTPPPPRDGGDFAKTSSSPAGRHVHHVVYRYHRSVDGDDDEDDEASERDYIDEDDVDDEGRWAIQSNDDVDVKVETDWSDASSLSPANYQSSRSPLPPPPLHCGLRHHPGQPHQQPQGLVASSQHFTGILRIVPWAFTTMDVSLAQPSYANWRRAF